MDLFNVKTLVYAIVAKSLAQTDVYIICHLNVSFEHTFVFFFPKEARIQVGSFWHDTITHQISLQNYKILMEIKIHKLIIEKIIQERKPTFQHSSTRTRVV